MLAASLRPSFAADLNWTTMKTHWQKVALLALLGILLQGCVAFPPLIQVEHKYPTENDELMRRLDAIDKRLGELEKKETK